MKELSPEEKEHKEKQYYKIAEHESPESDSLGNFVNKVSESIVFLDLLNRYGTFFENASRVLELGGGQGWASCNLKKMYPKLNITMTDISEDAVKSLHKWEYVYKVKIDEAYACKAYSTLEAENSLDVVFCFAAAHHFTHMDKVFQEMKRILKPGGHGFFFHEPTCTRLLYPLAYRRVNRLRPLVHEDVLVYQDLAKLVANSGLKSSIEYNPTTLYRRPKEALYYLMLSKSRYLQKWLPCSATIHIWKPK